MKIIRLGQVPASLVLTVMMLVVATSASAQVRRSFRVTSLAVADPHIFINLSPTLCSDATGILNTLVIAPLLTQCDPVTEGVPEPCTYGFNLVATFDPLDQTPGAGTSLATCMSSGQPCDLEFGLQPECIKNGTAVNCSGDVSTGATTTYANGGAGATCLATYPGTAGRNNLGVGPAPVPPAPITGPCAVSGVIDLTLNLGDNPTITIPLVGAQLGARYVGDPATGLMSGIARGFLSEEAADEIQITASLSGINIDAPLSQLLAGGTGNCQTAATQQDDRDFNPPGDTNGERGWWFYLTFAAGPATVPVQPTPTASATMVQADTPTPTLPQPTSTPVPTNTPVPTDTPAGVACPGDCNGNGEVPINEVQLAANIFLDAADISRCPAADTNGSGGVEINEVVQSSRSFQFDCPQ